MDLYRLNLNLLIALDVLFLEQNVTEAAKKLFITQAAMSNNLQKLREIFKDDLLIRDKNRMRLSAYAEMLQPKLHQVLQEVRSLIESGQRFEPETSTRLFKVGMPDYLAALLLPKLAAYLQHAAPHIRLSIIPSSHLSGIDAFQRGDYELGLGKAFEITSPIQKKLLFKDTGVCIMSRDHPLAKKKKITLKDYLSNKHVAVHSNHPNFPPVIEQSLGKLGFKRDVLIYIPFVLPIYQIIEESDNLLGTVIRSMTLVYQKKHSFVIKALPFSIPKIDFYAGWHHKYDQDLGHIWLREKIIEIAAEFSI